MKSAVVGDQLCSQIMATDYRLQTYILADSFKDVSVEYNIHCFERQENQGNACSVAVSMNAFDLYSQTKDVGALRLIVRDLMYTVESSLRCSQGISGCVAVPWSKKLLWLEVLQYWTWQQGLQVLKYKISNV